MSENHFLGLNPKTNSHVYRSRKKKLSKKTVLKMLAVMEASQAGSSNTPEGTGPPTSENNKQEFLSSGRTGRRNALPDILGQHAVVTSSDLPSKLQALSTTDRSAEMPTDQPSTSSGKS